MAINLDNERRYLESVAAKGGGAATWAQEQAKKYGITLGSPSVPAPSSVPTPTNSTPQQAKPPVPQVSVPTPTKPSNVSYGSNVSNFDPSNSQHRALADAGEQWWDAKLKNDQAGMDAAAKLGEQIRSGIVGSSYDARTGVSTLPVPQVQVPAPQAPQSTAPYMQLTPGQIQQEANYQIGKERADLKNAVDHMLGQIRNNANYVNQQIKDQRVLEDAQIGRSINPFSGRSNYLQSQITRGRQIDDTYRATNLENELTRIQNDLYNFDRLAPDKQRALVNEMTRIERDYGLQVGELTGWFNGQRTLAGQQFDWSKDPSNPAVVGQTISNKIAQHQLDNLPEQTRLELQQLEQRARQGEIDLQTAEWQLNELTNPQSFTNRSKALQMQMQELEARNLPERERLELQKLRKQIAEIGKQPALTDYEKQMQEIKLQTAQAELDKLKNTQSQDKPYQFNTTLANSIRQQAQTMGYIAEERDGFGQPTGNVRVTNPQALRNIIIAAGSSEEEIDALLSYFGLPTN